MINVEAEDIPGLEGRYMALVDGRIWSYRKKRVLKGEHHNGYVKIMIDGKQVFIHRLIAKTFIPNPENKPHVNHLNSVRDDNRVANLEWCTPAENNDHAIRSGRMPRGERHNFAKLSEADAKYIKYSRVAPSVLAKEFGIHRVLVWQIRTNLIWKGI